MAGKVIFDGGVKTQSIEAVKSLLNWHGRGSDPMPSFIELAGGVRLTKSSKGDAYYTTTPTNCSCPGRTYNPGHQCKHMKALLAGNSVEVSRAQARAYQARQRELIAKAKAGSLSDPSEPAKRLSKSPEDSIQPEGKWPGGFNGPITPLPEEA
jgi:hypothetical protein